MSSARSVMTALLTLVTMVLPVSAAHASDDPAFEAQWGLAQVRAERAWAWSTGEGIRIGIVDTGVDLGHEDLAGKVVAHTSCIGSAGNQAACRGSGQDDNGHGTHLAGVMAALRDNRRGISGVAPDAQLVVAKVLTSHLVAGVPDIIAGIKWVVDHGAQVVNLSLSNPDMLFLGTTGASLREALDYAADRGVVAVLSAGTTRRLRTGPERELRAVVAASTASDRHVSSTSVPTGGALLALLAPGGTSPGDTTTGVLSTSWTDDRDDVYDSRAGTSVAAAFVSGGIALLLAEGYTPWGAVDRLLSMADGRVPCDQDSPSCYGLMDLTAAMDGVREPRAR